MGQSDIVDFLKLEPDRWFTCREIALGQNVTKSTIVPALKKLTKYKVVDHKFVFGLVDGKRIKMDHYKYKVVKKK